MSELEFRIRLAALLATRLMSHEMGSPLRILRRAAGLGVWRGIIAKAAKHADAPLTEIMSRVEQLANDITSAWTMQIDGGPQEVQTLKAIRDYLSHGGRLAPDEHISVTEALRCGLHALDLALERLLHGSNVNHSDENVSLIIGDTTVSLTPFIRLEPQTGTFLLYANGGPDTPTYFSFNGPARRIVVADQARELSRYFVQQGDVPQVVQVFIQDLYQDLAAFSEDQDWPVSLGDDDDDALRVSWRRATSDGTEQRVDEFRLGANEARQWLQEDTWLPYSHFLRAICNWQTTASRLARSFRRIGETNASIEATYSGGSHGTEHVVAADVEVTNFDGSNPEAMSAQDVFAAVDANSAINVGRTRITFFTGEAGSGKTYAMLGAAIERAESIAIEKDDSNFDQEAPLYLYVRSTGRVLDDLSTVVEAAVASTRNLTDAGVKALVRNGLLTLLIDGFDELLGNSTYGDALGSLQPWLTALNGRGALVVSARSNYYLNEYKNSVLRASSAKLPPVHHRVASMLRWDTKALHTYLSSAGFDPTHLDSLHPDERELVRLPFFARILAGISPELVAQPDFSIVSELLERYVQRESKKLVTGTEPGEELLTPEELTRLFEDAALLMVGEAEREIGSEDLQLAAEVAISGGLAERPQLTRRLPNLCGLGIETGESVPRFRFQHEVYFDEFLAARLSRYADDGEDQHFVNALSYENWRAATMASVVRRVPAPRIRSLLERARRDISEERFSGTRAKNVRVNTGALWVRTMPDLLLDGGHLHIERVEILDGLDLSEMRNINLTVRDSRIDRLVLPPSGDWKVDLGGSRLLQLVHRGGTLQGLSGIDNFAIESFTGSRQIADRWPVIASELLRLGANMTATQFSDPIGPSLASYGREFLTGLARRAGNSFVLRQDRRFDPNDHDARLWSGVSKDLPRFIRAMEAAELAQCTNFSASGKRRVRMVFRVSISELLDEAADGRVREFWEGIS